MMFILFLLVACARACAEEISMALGLKTGVYMVGVLLVPLIVLSEDTEKFSRVARLVDSSWEIRMEILTFPFKNWM